MCQIQLGDLEAVPLCHHGFMASQFHGQMIAYIRCHRSQSTTINNINNINSSCVGMHCTHACTAAARTAGTYAIGSDPTEVPIDSTGSGPAHVCVSGLGVARIYMHVFYTRPVVLAKRFGVAHIWCTHGQTNSVRGSSKMCRRAMFLSVGVLQRHVKTDRHIHVAKLVFKIHACNVVLPELLEVTIASTRMRTRQGSLVDTYSSLFCLCSSAQSLDVGAHGTLHGAARNDTGASIRTVQQQTLVLRSKGAERAEEGQTERPVKDVGCAHVRAHTHGKVQPLCLLQTQAENPSCSTKAHLRLPRHGYNVRYSVRYNVR